MQTLRPYRPAAECVRTNEEGKREDIRRLPGRVMLALASGAEQTRFAIECAHAAQGIEEAF
ncbi:MAG: hypothetical protein WBY94_04320 [Polyangiaceae bacterium]